MRRLARFLLALSLAFPAGAAAKGPTRIEVCGAGECRMLKRVQPTPALTMPLFEAQGSRAAPPTTSSGWYEITMHFGDFPERFAFLQNPDYIRAVGKREGTVAPGEEDGRYGWLALTPEEARAHEGLVGNLEPLPISALPDLRATAPGLAVSVQAAASARARAAGDETVAPWLVIAGATALVGGGVFALWRHRRAAAKERRLEPAL